jgi:hypothetical protein
MHGKNAAPLASQIAPFVVVSAIAGAVWVGLSAVRAGIDVSDVATASSAIGGAPEAPAAPAAPARSTVLAKRDAIVYIDESDKKHYHAASHPGDVGSRRAVSVDNATCRGYSPCPVCCRTGKLAARKK